MRAYIDDNSYREWVAAYDTLGDADRQAIRDRVRQSSRLPLFSIVLLPTAVGAISATQASVASVLTQLYPRWELWLPQGMTSTDATADDRLRFTQSSETTAADLFNTTLMKAEGEFVLPLPTNAMLSEQALYEVAAAIGDHSEVKILYTDEDQLDASGARCMPCFKTGWDPDLMLGRDAIGLLVAYRKSVLERIGGMRSSALTTTLALYDLSLRAAFAVSAARIIHIPAVLCHHCVSLQSCCGWNAEGAREIVREHLSECLVSARVVPAPLNPAWNWVVRAVPDPPPLVSIIVPTRDQASLLERCADAVLSRTDYPAIELLIVNNDSREPATAELLRHLAQDPRVRILHAPGPFNYSALNNRAARDARGEVLVLLNNDTDAIRPNWLREMVSHAVRPDVGAVGAKLLYFDGRVQHGGMVFDPCSGLVHQFRFADGGDTGPSGELALARTMSFVTGACLAVRRSVFFEIGGLDQELRVEFNDIDLCLRLGDHGYRVVWTPFAELFHFEKATRGNDPTPEKLAIAADEHGYFRRRWGSLLDADPFRNANIAYGWDTITLSAPPQRKRPWMP